MIWGRNVVFMIDNMAVMFGWYNGYLKNNNSYMSNSKSYLIHNKSHLSNNMSYLTVIMNT